MCQIGGDSYPTLGGSEVYFFWSGTEVRESFGHWWLAWFGASRGQMAGRDWQEISCPTRIIVTYDCDIG